MVDRHDTPERVLYYWSKLFSSSLQTGQNYFELVPTIMISILNYPLFPQETDSFHNVFHLYEDNEHFIWSPHLEFHNIRGEREEGLKEGIQIAIKKMLSKGTAPETIADMLDYPLEEIKKIQREIE